MQRYGPLIADEAEKIAWGAYDPSFYGETSYLDSETPNASRSTGPAQLPSEYGRYGRLRRSAFRAGSSYSALARHAALHDQQHHPVGFPGAALDR